MSAYAQLIAALADPSLTISADGASHAITSVADRARRYAAGLRGAGVNPGDRVAVFADPSVDLVVANLGHYLAGAIHVPINTRYRGREVGHIVDNSGARAAVVDPAGAALMAEVGGPSLTIAVDGAEGCSVGLAELAAGDAVAERSAADDEVCMLIYTSGTTGPSKGVALSYGAVIGNMDRLTRGWGWSSDDRLSLMLPLFHVHGLCIGIHGAILRGTDILLHRGFDAAGVVADVAGGGATVFMGVPTMYRRLLEHLEATPGAADSLGGARLFTSGSAPLPAGDFRRFRELTGHAILERYGMSETLITLSNPLEGERRPGAVGMPVDGCQVRIVGEAGEMVEPGDPGELQVRGVGVMNGYWRLPDATSAAFEGDWFKTGDVARADPDGYLRIVGRTSVDIIKSGGFKISAREIEEVIETLPEIREAAVVGLPDPTWGQAIAAAVVVDGEEHEVAQRVIAHVAESLADYKKPRRVAVVAELPRNALGKLQKHRLIEQLTPGDGSSSG